LLPPRFDSLFLDDLLLLGADGAADDGALECTFVASLAFALLTASLFALCTICTRAALLFFEAFCPICSNLLFCLCCEEFERKKKTSQFVLKLFVAN
jgi:hypothetical protein